MNNAAQHATCHRCSLRLCAFAREIRRPLFSTEPPVALAHEQASAFSGEITLFSRQGREGRQGNTTFFIFFAALASFAREIPRPMFVEDAVAHRRKHYSRRDSRKRGTLLFHEASRRGCRKEFREKYGSGQRGAFVRGFSRSAVTVVAWRRAVSSEARHE
jgi:hypothetical protein